MCHKLSNKFINSLNSQPSAAVLETQQNNFDGLKLKILGKEHLEPTRKTSYTS